LAYSDDKNDLIDVANHLKINFDKAIKIRDILIEHKLIAEVNE
jgi:aminopeptidase-like protein